MMANFPLKSPFFGIEIHFCTHAKVICFSSACKNNISLTLRDSVSLHFNYPYMYTFLTWFTIPRSFFSENDFHLQKICEMSAKQERARYLIFGTAHGNVEEEEVKKGLTPHPICLTDDFAFFCLHLRGPEKVATFAGRNLSTLNAPFLSWSKTHGLREPFPFVVSFVMCFCTLYMHIIKFPLIKIPGLPEVLVHVFCYFLAKFLVIITGL